jgi:hypothetical protein
MPLLETRPRLQSRWAMATIFLSSKTVGRSVANCSGRRLLNAAVATVSELADCRTVDGPLEVLGETCDV